MHGSTIFSQWLWFLESPNTRVYPQPCRYYRLSPRRMSGDGAGLEVSFLERQQWSMGSLHTCSLLPSRCSWPLICCQTLLSWFPRQGKGDSAPDQHGAEKIGGCSCSSALCHLTRRETTPSQDMLPTVWDFLLLFWVCLWICFQGLGRFPHNVFPSLKWKYCVIHGLCDY